jgi:hypothetical protein
MKALGTLLLYFFTWRTVIIGSVFVGAALLALASSIFVFSSNGATAATMLAFIFLLAVPYLSAPYALRMIISNRRLAIVPGLPLRAGLALFVLTCLTAAFIPFSAWLLGGPATIFWLGPEIFVIASLYAMGMQLLVTSRYMLVAVNWLPIVLIVLVTLFGEQLVALAKSGLGVTLLASSAMAGWVYALAVLARRRNFKPRHIPEEGNMDREIAAGISSWFGRSTDRGVSRTASLLFGYPASLRSRVASILMALVFNPLIAVLLMLFMGRSQGGPMPFGATELFLAMSMLTGFVMASMHANETGARARLLWLRLPGARAKIWEKVESELWINFLLQLALAAVIAVAIALYKGGSALLVHYVLLVFALPLYQNYLTLCARLNHWTSLMQALVMIGSLGAIVVAIVYALRVANFNIGLLAELCLLVLSVVFRTYAKFGFDRVDWQVLRHTASKRAAEVS